jgi:hypothetical protein
VGCKGNPHGLLVGGEDLRRKLNGLEDTIKLNAGNGTSDFQKTLEIF